MESRPCSAPIHLFRGSPLVVSAASWRRGARAIACRRPFPCRHELVGARADQIGAVHLSQRNGEFPATIWWRQQVRLYRVQAWPNQDGDPLLNRK